MIEKIGYGLTALLLVLGLILGGAGAAAAGEGLAGWEKDGEYNQLYDIQEMDEFRCTILDFKEVTPMADMDPGLAMLVRDNDDEEILVHVGPLAFVDTRNIGLKKGDRVKIRGAWAEIDDEEIFMVSKIKRVDGFAYKIRLTSDGTPFWTMTPEQIAKENEGI